MSVSSALGKSLRTPREPLPVSLDELVGPYQDDLLGIQALYRFVLTESQSEESSGAAIQEVVARMLERGMPLETLDRMRVHLAATEGKWLRALLALLSARALGLEGPRVNKLAATVELIHVSTLIHDDIIDQSDMRRGLTTHAVLWGNRLAVLFGDYCYSRAIQLTTEIGDLEVMRIVSRATNLLVRGEIRQQVGLGDLSLDEEAYLETIRHKTGSLMSACIESACVLAGLPDEARQLGAEAGMRLGMAFQIVDDLLDYSAEPSQLGKCVMGDLANSTITLPLIHLFRVWPESRSLLDLEAGRVDEAELVVRLRQKGSLEYCQAAARREVEEAHRCWKALQPHLKHADATQRVHALIDFVTTRDH